MEIPDLFKKMLEHAIVIDHRCSHEDGAGWPQVGKLSAEDMGRSRAMAAEESERAGARELLVKKITTLKAQSMEAAAEWQEHIMKTYSLPRDNEFWLEDDGAIRMRPKKEKPS